MRCASKTHACNSSFRGPSPGTGARDTRTVMAHVLVKGRVSARRSATAEFLVDTGATYSIVPPGLAREVGAPMLPQKFVVSLADGTKRRLRACSLGVTIAGRSGPAIALVRPGAEPLLAVGTLELLGLKVNPDKGRLEPTRADAALLVGARPRHLGR